MENFFDTYHCHVFHPVRHIEVLFQSWYDVIWMSNGLVEGLRRQTRIFPGLVGVGSISHMIMLDIQSVGSETLISWPVAS